MRLSFFLTFTLPSLRFSSPPSPPPRLKPSYPPTSRTAVAYHMSWHETGTFILFEKQQPPSTHLPTSALCFFIFRPVRTSDQPAQTKKKKTNTITSTTPTMLSDLSALCFCVPSRERTKRTKKKTKKNKQQQRNPKLNTNHKKQGELRLSHTRTSHLTPALFPRGL